MLTLSGFVESMVRLFFSTSHILKLLFSCHSCIYRMFKILKTVLPKKGQRLRNIHKKMIHATILFTHYKSRAIADTICLKVLDWSFNK